MTAVVAGWPPLCSWLPNELSNLQRVICLRAHTDIGISEDKVAGQFTNRSTYIDECNELAGGKKGDYWCASWLRRIWDESGAQTVKKGLAPSCDEWMKWAKANKTWLANPGYGYAVVYGTPTDASHIGIVTRVTPLLQSVEGNTTVGTYFSRNGTSVDFKEVNQERVLGYIKPLPRSTP